MRARVSETIFRQRDLIDRYTFVFVFSVHSLNIDHFLSMCYVILWLRCSTLYNQWIWLDRREKERMKRTKLHTWSGVNVVMPMNRIVSISFDHHYFTMLFKHLYSIILISSLIDLPKLLFSISFTVLLFTEGHFLQFGIIE